jgi:hypothetical protein
VDAAVSVEDLWDRTGTTLNPATSTDDVEWDALRYLDATTGGVKNLYLGASSGGSLGDGNTGIGNDSLDAINNASAIRNTAIGTSSLTALTEGNRNNAFGYFALASLTTGGSNFGLGSQAAQNLTTGSNNLAIGTEALLNVTTSAGNTALGTRALNATTTGSYNIAIGNEACRVGTALGNNNVFIGRSSGRSATTGSANTAIGQFSGQNCVGGSNVFLGSYAGRSNTGSNNICIGDLAGDNLTGSSNVFIGHNAGDGQTALSDTLWIANTSTTTPLIYGDFSTNQIQFNSTTQYTDAAVRINNASGNAGDQYSELTFAEEGVDKVGFYYTVSGGVSSFSWYSYALGDDILTVETTEGIVDLKNGIKTSAIETITAASDTLDGSNHIVLCDATSNAITINLPAASGNTGLTYVIKKIDSSANAVTVDGSGAETIDGSTTAVISSQYDFYQIGTLLVNNITK